MRSVPPKRFRDLCAVFSFGVFLLGVAAAFLPGRTCGEYFFDDYETASKEIDLVMGSSKVVPVSNPKRVAIGDPKIADIVGAGNTELIVSAKGAGETNLQIWDDRGQREITIRVFEEDLSGLKDRLEELFKAAGIRGASFRAGDQERKVFVLGEVPARKKELAEQLLENFKTKTVNILTYSEDNPVVEIDVQILEIAKVAIDKLGIEWSPAVNFTEVPTPITHTMLPRHFPDMLKAIGQSQFDRSALLATLHILERDNMAKVLARPKLMALSGSEAKILVGGQVPVIADVSVSEGVATTSVEYKDYGIKLNIKPLVTESGDIRCQLEAEIKTIDTSTGLTIQTGEATTTTTPGFRTRTVSSELYLKNNNTIFMAGLIDSAQTNNLQMVPGLGRLPIIGALFRSKDFQNGASELVVSLTPRIVRYGDLRDEVQGAAITRKQLDEDPAEAYSRAVQEIILKNAGYPLEAQRANLSGEVVLSLHLLSSGQLVNVVVSQSSGHKLLDSAAIFTVKRLAPYPSFPKELMLKEIWVEVPITYQMN